MSYLGETKDGLLLLQLHVQPKGSKTKVVGLHDDRLKVAVAAPPVDGKANKELLLFLSRTLGVTRKDLQIKSGDQSRRKTVLISNSDRSTVHKKLERYL